MKPSWGILLPILFTASLVVIMFIPTVLDVNFRTGTAMACNRNVCARFVQYDSISYAYGGRGAYYQTGVNIYTTQGWFCSCPANSTNCCVPPYGTIVWTTVLLLLGADIVSVFLVTLRRPSKA